MTASELFALNIISGQELTQTEVLAHIESALRIGRDRSSKILVSLQTLGMIDIGSDRIVRKNIYKEV